MKSPLTGKPMPLIRQKQQMHFRKENFDIYQHFYVCIDSGGEFSTDTLRGLNELQAKNKYRHKYNLPGCDEITGIRKKYGLSASKMAEVLGFGVNVYRNYESGEVPSLSNARLIQLCDVPQNFLQLVNLCRALKESEYRRLLSRVRDIEAHCSSENYQMGKFLLPSCNKGICSGFVKAHQQFILQMIKSFTNWGPVKVKWLPLLFFLADFSYFRNNAKGVSGLLYKVENQMITFEAFLGIINWASGMGYCKISVNHGQGFLLPSMNAEASFSDISISRQMLEGITRNILNIQKEKEFSEITAEILNYSFVRSFSESGSFIPYEAAFELNCLDELKIWE